jgi:hypothetical protein
MNNIYLDIKDLIYFQERFPNKNFISIDDLIKDYENLIDEIDNLKEKIKDLEKDIEDNYKIIPIERKIF